MAYLTSAKRKEIAKKLRGSRYNYSLLLDEIAAALAADMNSDAQVRVQTVTNPAAASATAVLNAAALTVGALAGFVTGLSNPDVPRTLSVTGVASLTGTVTVHGTNIEDEVISEAFTLNGASAVAGTKAFKTVTAVDLPAWNAEGDTVSVGIAAKFGVERILAEDTLIKATAAGVHEATRPTVTVDADEIEKCLFAPNTAPNGSKTFKFYYFA